MRLSTARITKFKSIEDSTEVHIDEKVTVFLGQNEAGKTAFLQSLSKARSVERSESYNISEDYPRKDVNEYLKLHEKEAEVVATVSFELTEDEIKAVRRDLGGEDIPIDYISFTLCQDYANRFSVSVAVDILEKHYIAWLVEDYEVEPELKLKILSADTIRQVVEMLSSEKSLENSGKQLLDELNTRFDPESNSWENLLELYIWMHHAAPSVPKFMYFDDYKLLPGKVNLKSLNQKLQDDPEALDQAEKTVICLMSMANVDLEELLEAPNYETTKMRLETLSNSVTDLMFSYWSQNQELDVEFDIHPDPSDEPPFNDGPNLYIRIRNRRDRITVPFSARSKGFIWFFSFLVWLDSVKSQQDDGLDLILLLDEPGMNLHALVQNDLLRYIEHLSKEHQVLYSTHSPFMVQSDHLERVRLVENIAGVGTIISQNPDDVGYATVYPMQAALGFSIAKNLRVDKRNLMVESPTELVFLSYFTALLERMGREHLDHSIRIVPVGGLVNVSSFLALLGEEDTEVVVLLNEPGEQDQKKRRINERFVLTYSMFRFVPEGGEGQSSRSSTTIEDIISFQVYLRLFNDTYRNQLVGGELYQTSVSGKSRVVAEIEDYLVLNNLQLRPEGGYNRYMVACQLAAQPIGDIDHETLSRFEDLFRKVNSLFTTS